VAGIDYTTTALVSSIKRRILLPDAQTLYSDDELIAMAGEELASTIIPLIHSVQQEYWVVRQDVPLIVNQTNYVIPIRGVANGLRLLTLVDNGGNEIEFPLLRPENTASTYNWLSPYSTSTLYGFMMEDDHVVMFPQQLVNNPVSNVRFRFERLPNQLCSTDQAGQIMGIAGNVLTLNNVPTDWTTSLTYDLINGQPAFQSKGDDLVATNVNLGLSQVTLTAIPTSAKIGDWLCAASTSPVAQLPVPFLPYLAQCTAHLCLAGMTDTQAYQESKEKLTIMKEDLLKLLQPRDMGNVQTVINRGGLFDSGQFWGWSGGMYW
jgi:hypothetical protein